MYVKEKFNEFPLCKALWFLRIYHSLIMATGPKLLKPLWSLQVEISMFMVVEPEWWEHKD